MKYQKKHPDRKQFSEQTRKRMSEAKRGHKISESHRTNLRNSMLLRHKKVNILMEIFAKIEDFNDITEFKREEGICYVKTKSNDKWVAIYNQLTNEKI